MQLTAKTIAGDFPEWSQAFERIASPTADTSPPMFPELLPGRNVPKMAKLEKAFPGAIEWSEGEDGCIGSCASDPGLAWCVTNTALHYTGKKGFEHIVSDNGAAEYLTALAEQAGLPSIADFEARCDAINAGYGEPDNAAYNGERAFGQAEVAKGYIGNRKAPFEIGLVRKGGRILGLTVGAVHERRAWRETVQDWESLATRTVNHDGALEVVEGSYSVVMPGDGPQPCVTPLHYVDCEDGRRYPIADNGNAIHLDAKQIRALIGDSIFDVLEFPGADGKPRYVSQWLWDDGNTRFLCVQANGRTPKEGEPREYVTRAQVEAALAGEPVAIEATPTVETKGEPVTETVTPTDETEAPESAQERESEPVAGGEGGEAPESVPVAVSGEPETDCGQDPISVIRERLAELEELVAALSVAPERQKRTPAHERAIRRAWAERRKYRMAQCGYNGERIRANEAVQEREKYRAWWENVSKSASAIETDRTQAEAMLAEAREALAASERLREAAEAENRQLWAEIEAMTAPATEPVT